MCNGIVDHVFASVEASAVVSHVSAKRPSVRSPGRVSDITSCPTHTLLSSTARSHRRRTSGALLTRSNRGRPSQVSYEVNSYVSHSMDFSYSVRKLDCPREFKLSIISALPFPNYLHLYLYHRPSLNCPCTPHCVFVCIHSKC